MSFIFMVFHWPQPGHRETLARSMRDMGDLLARTPGCMWVEPPYFTEDGTCLVGISKWESRGAFLASGITLGPPGEIAEGETRPRERFLLDAPGVRAGGDVPGEGIGSEEGAGCRAL